MFVFVGKRVVFIAAVLWLFGLIFLSVAQAITLQEKEELERQLSELEKQIAQTEGIVDEYQEQSKTLKQEIARYNQNIEKTNLQIRAINLSINKLDADITETQNSVSATEYKLEEQKEALRAALQSMYEQETETLIEILLKSPSISQFFAGVNDLLEVQESLNSVLQETLDLRDKLLNEKENLAYQRGDKENLRLSEETAKKLLAGKKEEKNELLVVTKGKEELFQEILKVQQKTAAQIRNRIFEFLGGGQLTFEQAYKLAKSAADLTGVRPAMILAVLDKESALGANVGQCRYDQNPYYPDRANNPTTMHPTRDIPAFLEITGKLGISPTATLVSCPIPRDGAFGGAMGPAQFIPSTWALYDDRIAGLTGSNPPSPWRHLDAFVGTALYLKDSRESSACVKYSKEIPSQANTLLDRCAAAKYYAGGRWYSYRWTYGERVLEKARQFERDITQITN